jgi:hypothetical protein
MKNLSFLFVLLSLTGNMFAVEGNQTPVQQTETPVQQTETPVEPKETPVEPTETPVQKVSYSEQMKALVVTFKDGVMVVPNFVNDTLQKGDAGVNYVTSTIDGVVAPVYTPVVNVAKSAYNKTASAVSSAVSTVSSTTSSVVTFATERKLTSSLIVAAAVASYHYLTQDQDNQ